MKKTIHFDVMIDVDIDENDNNVDVEELAIEAVAEMSAYDLLHGYGVGVGNEY